MQLHPKDPTSKYNNNGQLFFEQEKYVKTEAAFHKTLPLNPTATGTYHNLGVLLMNQGKTQEAEVTFN